MNNLVPVENSIDASLIRNRQYVLDSFGSLDERHNFRVTAGGLALTDCDAEQLADIAAANQDYLNSLGKLNAVSQINDKTRRTQQMFAGLRSVFGTNLAYDNLMAANKADVVLDENAEAEAMELETAHNHPFVRLDLVKDAETHNFAIAEVEVGKMHGFGYTTLSRGMTRSPFGPGLVSQLQGSKPLAMFLSDKDRFYLPEAELFARAAAEAGVDLNLVTSTDCLAKIAGRTLLNHPGVGDHNFNGISCLSAPAEKYGEKAAMAPFANASQDQQLEALLLRSLSAEQLARLRKHLPETIFPPLYLGSGSKKRLQDLLSSQSDRYFVKRVNSSGARNIASPGDVAGQLDMLAKGKANVIIQRAIKPETQELPFIDVNSGEMGIGKYTIRYGLFVSAGKVIDLGLTASEGLIAHGGVSSIQMGADY